MNLEATQQGSTTKVRAYAGNYHPGEKIALHTSEITFERIEIDGKIYPADLIGNCGSITQFHSNVKNIERICDGNPNIDSETSFNFTMPSYNVKIEWGYNTD